MPQGCGAPLSRDWPLSWPSIPTATNKLVPCAKIAGSQIFTQEEEEGRAVDSY